MRRFLQSFCTDLTGRCVWETTCRSQSASVKAILHPGYIFLALWGCYQHPCDLLLFTLGVWEDIRDHQSSAAGTDSSGHPRGWLKRRGAKCPCHARRETLHTPDLSWCSFIFSNRADGGCRGEERDSKACQRSLRPSASVDKWNN